MFDPYELGDGLIVDRAAVHLAIDLEARGFQLRTEGDRLHLSSVAARDTLTPEDREAIKKLKTHLLVVVSFCEATKKRDTESVTPKRDVTRVTQRDALRKLLD